MAPGTSLTLQKVVKEAVLSVGFESSLSSPGVLRHSKRNMLVVTHVDDFLRCGDLDRLLESLSGSSAR